jgi:hypothetical protein
MEVLGGTALSIFKIKKKKKKQFLDDHAKN